MPEPGDVNERPCIFIHAEGTYMLPSYKALMAHLKAEHNPPERHILRGLGSSLTTESSASHGIFQDTVQIEADELSPEELLTVFECILKEPIPIQTLSSEED